MSDSIDRILNVIDVGLQSTSETAYDDVNGCVICGESSETDFCGPCRAAVLDDTHDTEPDDRDSFEVVPSATEAVRTLREVFTFIPYVGDGNEPEVLVLTEGNSTAAHPVFEAFRTLRQTLTNIWSEFIEEVTAGQPCYLTGDTPEMCCVDWDHPEQCWWLSEHGGGLVVDIDSSGNGESI